MIVSIKIISDNRVDIRYEDVLCKAFNHDFFIKLTASNLQEMLELLVLNLAKIDVRLPNLQLNNSPEFDTDANRLKLQIFEAMHQIATTSKIEFDGGTDVKLVIKKEIN